MPSGVMNRLPHWIWVLDLYDQKWPLAALAGLVPPAKPAFPAVERRKVMREMAFRPYDLERPCDIETLYDFIDYLPLKATGG